ncbi:MAG: NAD(P)/FAD-dependent oxidoreductase [Thermoplasmata archaeon]
MVLTERNDNTIAEPQYFTSVKKRYDIIVIGGGPVGCYAAKEFASAGYSVLVAEEHHEIGTPAHCAGFITPRCLNMVNEDGIAEKAILNRLTDARVHAPDGRILTVSGKVPRACLVNRAMFDRAVAERAVKSGAHILLNCKATGIEVDSNLKGQKDAVTVTLRFRGKDIKVRCSLLVGADGISGFTAHCMGLPSPEYILPGIIFRMAGLNLREDTVELFVGKDIVPDFFAWAIPQDNLGNGLVGLALGCIPPSAGSGYKKTPQHLKEILKQHITGAEGEERAVFTSEGIETFSPLAFLQNLILHPAYSSIFSKAKILGYHAGAIPVGFNRRTYTDNIMLVGDAASQVKPLSGGGLYTGFIAASCLFKVGVQALRKGDLSSEVLADYQRMWESAIGKEIKIGLMLRKAWLELDDKTINSILKDLDEPELLQLVSTFGDIDYPSRLAKIMLRKAPRFLKYAPGVIVSMLTSEG